jgi:hypothetical protein
MARTKLTKAQKEQLLQWVGEGLTSGEINERAAKLDPPFEVTRAHVDYYRRTRAIKLADLSKEEDALSTGLALRAVRVSKLQALAELMEDDLLNGNLWVTDIKYVGNQQVNVEKFNSAEVSEYRATLAQIADEVGDKKPDQIIPSEITVRFVKGEK